jgi:ribosomal protein S18 acetylase RimI-like enzyme
MSQHTIIERGNSGKALASECDVSNELGIRALSLEEALDRADEILALYKVGWLTTYPSVERGITTRDIEAYFSENNDFLPYWRSEILGKADRLVFAAFAGQDELKSHAATVPHEGAVMLVFCVVRFGGECNEFEYIYLRPEMKGKGLGAKLARAGLTALGQDKPIELFVAAENARAIAFYERFGFLVTNEQISGKVLPSGVEIPAKRMVREGSLKG